jgi:hypothetical protein
MLRLIVYKLMVASVSQLRLRNGSRQATFTGPHRQSCLSPCSRCQGTVQATPRNAFIVAHLLQRIYLIFSLALIALLLSLLLS